jgi:hypothetical protein
MYTYICLHPEPSTLYIPNTEPKLPNFEHPLRAILSLLSNNGLIKYIDTKAKCPKCRHLKKFDL